MNNKNKKVWKIILVDNLINYINKFKKLEKY